ncbi:MAG: fluoride efflux transporter CrcB [Chlamydiae bacterium]|nr:fluoride efflux transporter CrcB [Chlamydiota bacterium]
MASILSIALGAIFGACLRWWFALKLNPLFPTLPLGTLTANLIGGFLMGVFMSIIKDHSYIPQNIRLAITTGFLGALTTFSTFSAETVTLLSHQEYGWAAILMICHVAGSILATILGVYVFKILTI